MLVMVSGGSGSGKSSYAEKFICDIARDCSRFYLATMPVYGEEGRQIVERHRAMRADKGFTTIEQQTDIDEAVAKALKYLAEAGSTSCSGEKENGGRAGSFTCDSNGESLSSLDSENIGEGKLKNSAALLECISNLTANEMFSEETPKKAREVVGKVMEGIKVLNESFTHLVVVTYNVFEDGIKYDATTMEYIKAMGDINNHIAAMADVVVESVVGIPIIHKDLR
ncbi:MAG: bifunctional adenosylcobinamide kinase/adenosylcobinamide-phosphate guanylyltransferase [Eubacteriales bacterium]|nr:bifunctional adenosylcobinamide kinase/adenosylcobinamide-phosphate guanylyltransferase [Eubacteriales bacterium]